MGMYLFLVVAICLWPSRRRFGGRSIQTSLVYYNTESDPVPKVGDPVRDQEIVKKRNIDWNFTNRLYGYSIYSEVVVHVSEESACSD